MVKTFDELSAIDIIRQPYFYNHLIKSCSSKHLPRFLEHIGPGELIADIGSGPSTVLPFHLNVIRCDLSADFKPDVACAAAELPFKDGALDHVCCAGVLEHLEDPADALLEFNRILKDGGFLYLTTNFAWHLHDQPRDFFRYSHLGLKHLFNKYGRWEVAFLEPTSGFWVSLLQMLNYKIARTFHRAHPLLTVPIQLVSMWLERKNFDPALCAGYCVIAKKTGKADSL